MEKISPPETKKIPEDFDSLLAYILREAGSYSGERYPEMTPREEAEYNVIACKAVLAEMRKETDRRDATKEEYLREKTAIKLLASFKAIKRLIDLMGDADFKEQEGFLRSQLELLLSRP